MPQTPVPDSFSGLKKAIETVVALRGENGCPWDKAQTHESLRKYLLEETYETLEAIDVLSTAPSPAATKNLKEELGDVLLQVLLHSEIARQNGDFSLDDVARDLAEKLIRRHPHVFGDEKLSTPEEVVGAWEKNKQAEKPERKSVLTGIPTALPALQRSLKVIEKVSKVGFQWPDLKGPLEKMREELGEFEAEVTKASAGTALTRENAARLPLEMRRKIESELGDLLFTVANVAHFLQLNPEDSLRSMLARFESRFKQVEQGAEKAGRKLEEMRLAEMDELWNEAKRRERK